MTTIGVITFCLFFYAYIHISKTSQVEAKPTPEVVLIERSVIQYQAEAEKYKDLRDNAEEVMRTAQAKYELNTWLTRCYDKKLQTAHRDIDCAGMSVDMLKKEYAVFR